MGAKFRQQETGTLLVRTRRVPRLTTCCAEFQLEKFPQYFIYIVYIASSTIRRNAGGGITEACGLRPGDCTMHWIDSPRLGYDQVTSAYLS